MIDRIIPNIFIQIALVVVADRISLQETAERRRVHAGLVVIEPELRELGLACVLEPSEVRWPGDAIFVVAVGGGERAVGVAHRDDRPLLVGEQITARAGCVPDPRIVGVAAAGVDVAAEQGARAIIFRDQIVAVVEELGDIGAAGKLEQPPERVVDERCRMCTGDADHAVLDVVAVGVRPVRGEIAVEVVGQCQRRAADGSDLTVLVEAVGRGRTPALLGQGRTVEPIIGIKGREAVRRAELQPVPVAVVMVA